MNLTTTKIESARIQQEQMKLENKMKKLDILSDIRAKHPHLTNQQIRALFPELASFMDIVDNALP